MGAHWAPGFRCARRHFLSLTYTFHALCTAQQHSVGQGRAGLSPSARGGRPRLVSALRACAGAPGPAADFFAPYSSVCLLRCLQQPGVGGGPYRALHSAGSALLHGRCTAGPRARMLPCSWPRTAGPRARMLPVEAPRLLAGGPALGACLEARPRRSALRRTVTARSSTLLAAPALLLSLLVSRVVGFFTHACTCAVTVTTCLLALPRHAGDVTDIFLT